MGKILLLIALLVCVSSCEWNASTDTFNSPKLLRVEFVGASVKTILNTKGTATLFAVSEMLADASATEISTVEFDSKAVPFNVDFEIPKNHRKLIRPELKKGEAIQYYVALEWDSNGDGGIGEGDIMIDFDKAFPNVEMNKETQRVFVR